MAIFSLHPVKAITTAEGGVVTTRDPRAGRAPARSSATTASSATREASRARRGALVPRAAAARLQLPAHRHPRRARPLAAGQARPLRRAPATRSRPATARGLAASTARPATRRAGEGSLHAHHLFVVRHREGAGPPAALYDGCASARSAPRSTTSPSTATPTTADASATAPGLCPEAERYYSGCLSLPCFPALTAAEQDEVADAHGAMAEPAPASFEIGGRSVGGATPPT